MRVGGRRRHGRNCAGSSGLLKNEGTSIAGGVGERSSGTSKAVASSISPPSSG